MLREFPLDTIRRFFRGTERYMDASRERNGQRLTPAEAAWVSKRFSSHRRIPDKDFKLVIDARKAPKVSQED